MTMSTPSNGEDVESWEAALVKLELRRGGEEGEDMMIVLLLAANRILVRCRQAVEMHVMSEALPVGTRDPSLVSVYCALTRSSLQDLEAHKIRGGTISEGPKSDNVAGAVLETIDFNDQSPTLIPVSA
jgi:hypothetical protein